MSPYKGEERSEKLLLPSCESPIRWCMHIRR